MLTAALACTGFSVLSGIWIKDRFMAVNHAMASMPAWLKEVNATPDTFAMKCVIKGNCFRAMQTAVQNINPPVTIPMTGALLGLLAFVGGYRAYKSQDMKATLLPLLQRWALLEDVTKYHVPNTKLSKNSLTGYMGVFAHNKERIILRVPERQLNAHVLVMGAPGARKTTGYFQQAMLSNAMYGQSAIVFDLKYPDDSLIKMVQANHRLGRDVQFFLPFSPHTMSLNVLEGVNDMASAQEVAETLCPKSMKPGPGDFYQDQERALAAGLIYGVVAEENATMSAVVEILEGGADSVRNYITKHHDKDVQRQTANILQLRADMIAGIISGLTDKLRLFSNPTLQRATTSNPGKELNLERVFTSPGILYIGIPERHIRGTKGYALLKLLYRMINNASQRIAEANGGELPVQTNVYMDEFPSFGPIPNIETDLATMRSRRLAFHVAIQNFAQLYRVYEKDVAEAIKALFQHYFIFPARVRGKDAEEISELIGEMTTIQAGLGISKSGMLGNSTHSKNWRTATEQMLSVEQMSVFPEDMAVVIPMGGRPIKIYVPRFDEVLCGGQPNPFYKYEKLIWEGLPKPLDWISRYVAAMERGEIAPLKNVGAGPEQQEGNSNMAKAKAARDEFLTWVDSVAEHRPEIKLLAPPDTSKADKKGDGKGDKKGEKTQPPKPAPVTDKERHNWKVQVSRARLPKELLDPVILERFNKAGWISDNYATSNTHLSILRTGKMLMSEEKVKKLHDLAYVGYSASWEQQYAPKLKGHPDFDKTTKGQPEGYWLEQETVLVTHTLAQALLEQTPDKALVVKGTPETGGRDLYRLVIYDLDFLKKYAAEPSTRIASKQAEKEAEPPQLPTDKDAARAGLGHTPVVGVVSQNDIPVNETPAVGVPVTPAPPTPASPQGQQGTPSAQTSPTGSPSVQTAPSNAPAGQAAGARPPADQTPVARPPAVKPEPAPQAAPAPQVPAPTIPDGREVLESLRPVDQGPGTAAAQATTPAPQKQDVAAPPAATPETPDAKPRFGVLNAGEKQAEKPSGGNGERRGAGNPGRTNGRQQPRGQNQSRGGTAQNSGQSQQVQGRPPVQAQHPAPPAPVQPTQTPAAPTRAGGNPNMQTRPSTRIKPITSVAAKKPDES